MSHTRWESPGTWKMAGVSRGRPLFQPRTTFVRTCVICIVRTSGPLHVRIRPLSSVHHHSNATHHPSIITHGHHQDPSIPHSLHLIEVHGTTKTPRYFPSKYLHSGRERDMWWWWCSDAAREKKKNKKKKIKRQREGEGGRRGGYRGRPPRRLQHTSATKDIHTH